MDVQFSITGADEIEKVLKEMPFVVRRRVVAAAVRSGAAVIRKEARRLAPKDEKRGQGVHLSDPKGIIVKKKRGTNDIYQVGPSKEVPHGHLVEFGTTHRQLKKPRWFNLNGRWVYLTHSGTMPAKPYLRPAVDNKGREAIKKIGERFGVLIPKHAEKLAGKYRTSGVAASKRRYRR